MRRLILSRKGFDSSAGGVPSPIFPDGRIISLPIPDCRTNLQYKDINIWEYNLGEIVKDLTREKIPLDWKIHLDPDLNSKLKSERLSRSPDWRPIFGQAGAAQGHLKNQKVSVGDLFLFFGLFQEVELKYGHWVFRKDTKPKHLIWGWLQIDQILKVDDIVQDQLNWARYHPHFNRSEDKTNTLYISSRDLHFSSDSGKIMNGAGVFEHYSEHRQLTDLNSTSTLWKLPAWFFPEIGRSPLTYHSDISRWKLTTDAALLRSVSKGQEFVLQLDHYPQLEVFSWLESVLQPTGFSDKSSNE